MCDKQNKVLQYFAAITGCLTALGYGTVLVWGSLALPFLQSPESNIKITRYQGSWIGILHQAGFLVGFLLNPIFVDWKGRKWTLLFFSIPQTISWLLIIYARNEIYFYCARIIGGIGYGGGLCAITIYMSEIGNKKNRGTFLALIRLAIGFGFLLSTFLDAYFSYEQMNYILLMLPIIFGATFSFVPDSYYFEEINEKIENEELSVYEMNVGEKSEKGEIHSLRDFSLCKLFLSSTNRKSLIIVMSMGLLRIMSGQATIGSFGPQLLTCRNLTIDSKKGIILLLVFNSISCLLSMQILEHVKRRIILIFAGSFSSVSLLITGFYFYFYMDEDYIYANFRGVPIIFLSIFDVFLSIGHGNLFYIFQGEFFAKDVKSIGVTVVKFFYLLFDCYMIYNFKKLEFTVNMYMIFLIYGICCGVGTIFVYVIVPETKGMTLRDIQNNVRNNKLFHRINNWLRKIRNGF